MCPNFIPIPQIAVLDTTWHESDQANRDLEQELATAQERCHTLEDELLALNERLLDVERSREVLEQVGVTA